MKLLIVVDMQNDFIDGALGTREAVSIVSPVAEKIRAYEKRGDKVIFTRDTHEENYMETQEGKKLPVPHCIRGTHGWEITPALPSEGCTVVDKVTFGSWELPEAVLREMDGKLPESIELVGLCTDICVISNALLLKARFPEVPIAVDPARCAGVTPASHENALSAMKMCQIDILG